MSSIGEGDEVFDDENLQQQFVHELLFDDASSLLLLLLLLLLFSFSLEGFVLRKSKSCSEPDAPPTAVRSTQLFWSSLLLSNDFCFFG
jgi:hypothetical protein